MVVPKRCCVLLSVASSVLFFLLTSSAAHAEGIFLYNGKTYSSGDLSPVAQQNLHDLETEHYLRLEALAEQTALDLWVEDQAKAKHKTKEEIEAEAFKAPDPTDKDVEAWYKENKDRLPPGYKLEQISGDIKTLLAGEGRKKARDKVIEALKAKGAFKLVMKEPEAPVFKITTEGYHVRGKSDAPVTIVEFADYQCPHCRAAQGVISKILKKYKNKVKLVYIDFPINQSGISTLVAHGAYCAGKLGKYWEYHDLAFEKQRDLGPDAPKTLAKELKLDEKKFDDCLATAEPKAFVEKSKEEGERIGVSGTPGIFLNGAKVKSYEEKDLSEDIERLLSGKSS